MREIIRFAWGTSSLGDFMAAMSDQGLVALEFSTDHTAREDALRIRIPEIDIVESRQGLADVLEKVKGAIEEPGFDPSIPLDLRGTPYQVEVWSMLRAIQVGETTSYGALGNGASVPARHQAFRCAIATVPEASAPCPSFGTTSSLGETPG